METFMDNNSVAMALVPTADIWAASPATDVYNMANYDEITFLIYEAAGGTGTATITIEECTSAAGAGNSAIAFRYKTSTTCATTATWSDWTAVASTGVAPGAGANKITACMVRASELSDGSNFVRAQMTEVDSTAVLGGGFAILSNCRYPQENPPDPTS